MGKNLVINGCSYMAYYADWGGHTTFTTEQGVVTRYPTPNSMVFFDSTIPYATMDSTARCLELRVTVAFKLHRP
jgi:hypothetical protein